MFQGRRWWQKNHGWQRTHLWPQVGRCATRAEPVGWHSRTATTKRLEFFWRQGSQKNCRWADFGGVQLGVDTKLVFLSPSRAVARNAFHFLSWNEFSWHFPAHFLAALENQAIQCLIIGHANGKAHCQSRLSTPHAVRVAHAVPCCRQTATKSRWQARWILVKPRCPTGSPCRNRTSCCASCPHTQGFAQYSPKNRFHVK